MYKKRKHRINIYLTFNLICLASLSSIYTLNGQGFTEIGESIGISYDFKTNEYGGGVSFVDFNQDGLDDLTFATGAGSPIRFHISTGDGFIEIAPLISDTTEVKQVLWVDYNNDGNLDLYLTSTNQNRLYKNVGNLNMTDITESCGFNDPQLISYCSSWFDYNNDGLLDLCVSHRTEEKSGWITLYKNLGNDKFENVTSKAKLTGKGNSVLSMTSFDMNNDGWNDLFLAQDYKSGNQLLKNNGNGTFDDISASSGADQKINSMTATVGDYNQDGWIDIYVSNTFEGNILLKNNANETFTEQAEEMAVDISSLTFGSVFFDADNDTDLDLHVVGSRVNYMLENPGTGPFNSVEFLWGFSKDKYFNNGLAIGDFNKDGYPDLVKNSMTNASQNPGKNTFWRNNFEENNYLTVELNGTISNLKGVGAVIDLVNDNKHQIRRVGCGESYSSQHSYLQFFGLGQADYVDQLTIYWPSGNVTVETHLDINQKIIIKESQSGCLDPTACNYNPDAISDNGHCRYATTIYDCDGCLNDQDNDGVCDELELPGCTDINACNYDPDATNENGTCWYLPTYDIIGTISIIPPVTEEYAYQGNPESTFLWKAVNGVILNGQGTSEISVRWYDIPSCSISVTEISTDNCHSSEITKKIEFSVPTAVIIKNKKVQIYPNPATEMIYLDTNERLKEVTIWDVTGREFKFTPTYDNDIQSLNISSLNSGVYILKYNGTTERIVKK